MHRKLLDWEDKQIEANSVFRLWEEFKLKVPQTLIKVYESTVNWTKTNTLISYIPHKPTNVEHSKC